MAEQADVADISALAGKRCERVSIIDVDHKWRDGLRVADAAIWEFAATSSWTWQQLYAGRLEDPF